MESHHKELPWMGFEPQTWKRGIWSGAAAAIVWWTAAHSRHAVKHRCGGKKGKRPMMPIASHSIPMDVHKKACFFYDKISCPALYSDVRWLAFFFLLLSAMFRCKQLDQSTWQTISASPWKRGFAPNKASPSPAFATLSMPYTTISLWYFFLMKKNSTPRALTLFSLIFLWIVRGMDPDYTHPPFCTKLHTLLKSWLPGNYPTKLSLI